jgi:hypothetical protein
MLEKDYIMREVQKLTQVLQVIMGLKQERKYDMAMNEIQNSYELYFDDEKIQQAKTVDDLVDQCSKDGEFVPDLAFALADIINEDAEISELEGEVTKAKKKFKLALGLYKRALSEEHAAVPIEIAEKIQDLEKKAESE